MSNIIIGLTGGIGSGKTTVANMFAELGIDVVDADIVAREVVEPGSKALVAISMHFGDSILTDSGHLDRAALRELIFNNPEHKSWLNNLLHPIIREELSTKLGNCQSPYCLLVAPLLFENGLDQQVDRSLVIDIPQEKQIERTVKRDGSTTSTIENIIAAQIPRVQRLKKADDVIDNSGLDLAQVRGRVAELHQQYLAMTSNQ